MVMWIPLLPVSGKNDLTWSYLTEKPRTMSVKDLVRFRKVPSGAHKIQSKWQFTSPIWNASGLFCSEANWCPESLTTTSKVLKCLLEVRKSFLFLPLQTLRQTGTINLGLFLHSSSDRLTPEQQQRYTLTCRTQNHSNLLRTKLHIWAIQSHSTDCSIMIASGVVF